MARLASKAWSFLAICTTYVNPMQEHCRTCIYRKTQTNLQISKCPKRYIIKVRRFKYTKMQRCKDIKTRRYEDMQRTVCIQNPRLYHSIAQKLRSKANRDPVIGMVSLGSWSSMLLGKSGFCSIYDTGLVPRPLHNSATVYELLS